MPDWVEKSEFYIDFNATTIRDYPQTFQSNFIPINGIILQSCNFLYPEHSSSEF